MLPLAPILTLAVDTSTRIGSLAILRGQEILGEISSSANEPYSSRLFSDLDKLLGDLGLSLNQCDLFAVAAGPGSFTGLRIGLTAVKAWAEIYGRPIVPVSGLQAVAAQVLAPAEGAILAPVIDARRGQVFGAIYECRKGVGVSPNPFLKLLDDEVVMGAEEFLEMVANRSLGTPPIFVSPTPEVIQSALERSPFAGARLEKVSSVLAAVIGRLGYQAALRGEGIDALHLDANYVRRCGAEVHLKSP